MAVDSTSYHAIAALDLRYGLAVAMFIAARWRIAGSNTYILLWRRCPK